MFKRISSTAYFIMTITLLFAGINLQAQTNINNSRKSAITEAVRIVSPAIVGITVTEVIRTQSPLSQYFGNDPFFDLFRGQMGGRDMEVHGLGSGFIISKDGYIVTNHHVAGNASKIIVTMTGGEKYDAKVIGADETSDVALLKIDADKDLPYLKFCNSDDIIPGEWAIAFGNPFGLFDLNAKPTVTVGVVSNFGVDFVQDNKRVYKGMVQTDAAISSGNSGGPLVNGNGEVIGMNTVIFSTAQNGSGAGSIGIGWAIPSNRVSNIVNRLKKDKQINRNFFLGMDLQILDTRIAKYYKIDSEYGLFVTRTYNNSAATLAGIEPGDLIMEVDGKKIRKAEDFYMAVFDAEVGQKFEFEILRANEKIITSYTLRERN